MKRSQRPLKLDDFPDVFAPPANGMGFTTPTWLPKIVVGLILFIVIDGTFGAYRSIRETECINGDRHSCQIAKDYWRFAPTTLSDKPKCPDGCICTPEHGYPICGARKPPGSGRWISVSGNEAIFPQTVHSQWRCEDRDQAKR